MRVSDPKTHLALWHCLQAVLSAVERPGEAVWRREGVHRTHYRHILSWRHRHHLLIYLTLWRICGEIRRGRCH
ncbi:hypothetical protein E2C01_011634 [Portunus trituberculatus]|uniref:Uncharacterized protein n=1 Tax=Portunus trituberculatus TaxID=210409 RepID=A0A5B7DBV4_PORTR|nr:hypothetical protein [Portunus trituberculatus]